MTDKVYASVWDAIEDTAQEAENMKVRSRLMRHIESEIAGRGWTQAEAATRLGVTQPRISDLTRGKISLFAIDSLVNMVAAMGMHVDVRVKTPPKRGAARSKLTA